MANRPAWIDEYFITQGGILTNSAGGTQNDIASVDANGERVSAIVFTAATTVNGIESLVDEEEELDPRVLVLFAIGGALTIGHEQAGSAETSRVKTSSGASVVIPDESVAFAIFNPAERRWRVAASALAGDSAGVATVTAHTVLHKPNEEQLQTEIQINVRTPSNTPTNLFEYTTTDDRLYVAKGFIVAQSADLAEMAYWNIDCLVKNDGGSLTIVTADDGITQEHNETGTPAIDLDDFGETLQLVAGGVNGVPVRWTGRILIHEIISVPDV